MNKSYIIGDEPASINLACALEFLSTELLHYLIYNIDALKPVLEFLSTELLHKLNNNNEFGIK